MKTNVFNIQAYDSITCGYFCIGFIDFMLAEKTFIELQILFHQVTLKKWWYFFELFYDKWTQFR